MVIHWNGLPKGSGGIVTPAKLQKECGCGIWGHGLVVTYSRAKLTFGFDDLRGLFQPQQFSDFIISTITDTPFKFSNFYIYIQQKIWFCFCPCTLIQINILAPALYKLSSLWKGAYFEWLLLPKNKVFSVQIYSRMLLSWKKHKSSPVVNSGACEISSLLPGVRKTEVLISGKRVSGVIKQTQTLLSSFKDWLIRDAWIRGRGLEKFIQLLFPPHKLQGRFKPSPCGRLIMEFVFRWN